MEVLQLQLAPLSALAPTQETHKLTGQRSNRNYRRIPLMPERTESELLPEINEKFAVQSSAGTRTHTIDRYCDNAWNNKVFSLINKTCFALISSNGKVQIMVIVI